MNDLAKLLLSIAIVGFLPVVPLTSGEAAWKPTEAVSRKDAKTAISGDQTSKSDAAVTAFRSRQSIPGLSVAIARDNQIIFRRPDGLTDLENQDPPTAVTACRIASDSKPQGAFDALQLAKKGQ